jgi:hypothetical protein
MADNTFLENLYKQHPELKDKSLNEIKRQIDQLSIVMRDKEREEEERRLKELQDNIAAARVEYDKEFERRKESWLDDFKWFLRHDLIKPEVVKIATSASGAVVLTNLLKRGFPTDFVPPELADNSEVAKAAGRKKEYAPPPVSSTGEAFSDAVLRIVQSYNGKGQTIDVIKGNVIEDPAFKKDLEQNTRRLTLTLNGLVRKGKVKKTDDGRFVAA